MPINCDIILLSFFECPSVCYEFSSSSLLQEENNGDIAVMAKDMNSTANLVDFIIIFVLSYT